jgi:tRNA (cytidine/uridine-2'-O-)-methyltransferase
VIGQAVKKKECEIVSLAVILYEPEIPPNTGNIIRLCANAGASLHLIEPLGFSLDEKALRRAGMDYSELANVRVHPSLEACLAYLTPKRLFVLTTKTTHRYDQVCYQAGDAVMFGPESRGLPEGVRFSVPESQRITIPMRQGCRSLNLSNAVSVVVYEVWRQMDFSDKL